MTSHTPIAYIGSPGTSLGHRLAGIETFEEVDGEAAVHRLKELRESKQHQIIFLDEGLAEPVLSAIDRLNADPLPAIVLVPNAAAPRQLAAKRMQQLMMKAVGVDIFSDKNNQSKS